MAVVANFAQRIKAFHANALHFTKLSRRRHLRAAMLARRALIAKQNGYHRRATLLMRRALRVKAAAARAMFRAKVNRVRVVAARRARRARFLRAR